MANRIPVRIKMAIIEWLLGVDYPPTKSEWKRWRRISVRADVYADMAQGREN